ncbi:Vacuolar protein sorting-associated protein 33A [Neolecta irregularis DAH-3]|uniref:Vacuolar protein sorting-associated protein 33A n=1 Tax=Neolecta irregularis (strain DAH-3) TaxID=1198029 RepID=A0A1U7LKN9_NEOID|nr:Vacuolar protein sorting-associated protein 33A [Neolecta irregularis DAH-3]|eukprot:OLL23163.1 Vacuolar protein sorting-associated protein 33A [Neolecta irregularis DAH-3]
MLTPLTYAGLLGELSLTDTPLSSDTLPSISSDTPPSDKLFAQLGDSHFAVVGALLHRVARSLHDDYAARHRATTVAQLKHFVASLGALQARHSSLRLHTALAEHIAARTATPLFAALLDAQQLMLAADPAAHTAPILDLVARHPPLPLPLVLRLLVLHSAVANGIRPKDLLLFKKEVLHTYGYHHLLTFANLEKAGLLKPRSPNAKSAWPLLRKALRLIVDDVDDHDPQDIAYVYSGYAPLSVRLVQAVLQKHLFQKLPPAAAGWKGFEDILRHVPGKTFDEFQKADSLSSGSRLLTLDPSQPKPKITVVFFLGGITWAEIAALRFMMAKENSDRRILIATTGIIDGNSMIESLIYCPD